MATTRHTTPSESIRPTLRERRRAQRADRAAERALRDDLASYSTPAELIELSALLRRHDDQDAEPIRRIVHWHAA